MLYSTSSQLHSRSLGRIWESTSHDRTVPSSTAAPLLLSFGAGGPQRSGLRGLSLGRYRLGYVQSAILFASLQIGARSPHLWSAAALLPLSAMRHPPVDRRPLSSSQKALAPPALTLDAFYTQELEDPAITN